VTTTAKMRVAVCAAQGCDCRWPLCLLNMSPPIFQGSEPPRAQTRRSNRYCIVALSGESASEASSVCEGVAELLHVCDVQCLSKAAGT
jgi:hypothetical protein